MQIKEPEKFRQNIIHKFTEIIKCDIISNHTSFNSNVEHIIDLLSKHGKVVAVFGPEHGIKGDIDDRTT